MELPIRFTQNQHEAKKASQNPRLTVIVDDAQAKATLQAIDAQANNINVKTEMIKTNLRYAWREFSMITNLLVKNLQENAAIAIINLVDQIAISEFAVYQTILHAQALMAVNPIGAGLLYSIAATMQISILDAYARKAQMEESQRALNEMIVFHEVYI